MAPFLNGDLSANNGIDHNDKADGSMPIAIVGMSFRGPGSANNIETLFKMICEKRESRTAIPKSRWNNKAFYHPNFQRHGSHNVEYGHFFQDDISKFDAPFFNMTREEAAALDPAQRLLLETTYEALENGGIPLEKIVGTKTSVFVGSFATDYTDLLTRDPESVPMYQCTNSGQSRAMVSNRLSYFFDLHGPSVTVDTACSGSLVALHLACQSLRTGEANSAIAAGVNVVLNHEFMTTMSMMKFLSPDGRCYAFDERGNGYGRGEGVGTVFLKPLADALKDGDTIRAVIRGSASNQDGKTSGITLPNPVAQEALIRDVYHAADLDPLDTGIVEAHGTGTAAGDPLELRALTNSFCGTNRPEDRPLVIGSIKSNLGHLEGASGIAAVVKAVLMLEQEVILPNQNFEKPNPRIPFADRKLRVPTEMQPWDSSGPLRVSINSFGYGGSNAHVILESTRTYLSSRGLSSAQKVPTHFLRHRYGVANASPKLAGALMYENGDPPVDSVLPNHSRPKLFTLSVFDEPTAQQQIQTLVKHLQERGMSRQAGFLDDLAFTLNERRTNFIWRASVVAASLKELIGALSRPTKFSRSLKSPTLGFVFTGQGAQWCGMAKELLEVYPVFKTTIRRIGKYLHSIGAPFNVEEEITMDPKVSKINKALYSQPMCSAIQIALVELLASWNIRPTSVTGHSSGEIASAYAIGALSLEDAMTAAYYRGVCSTKMQEEHKANGAMMAAGLSEEDATRFLAELKSGKAVVACSNSPSSVTISGDVSAVGELQKILESKGIFARMLAVEVAYHSHHMELVAEEYAKAIAGIRIRQGNGAKFYSSVYGREVGTEELGPSYWVKNLLCQVKFTDAIRQLCLAPAIQSKRRQVKRHGVDVLVEIGPHSALAGPIKETIQSDPKLKAADITYTSALVRKMDAVRTVLDLAGKLSAIGYQVNFSAMNRPTADHSASVLVDLPSYTWNHSTSYWAEPRRSKAFRNRTFPRVDILGVRDENSDPLQLSWRNHLRTSEIPWLLQHKIQSSVVFPAAGFIAMAIEAAAQRSKERLNKQVSGYQLREVNIGTALLLPEQESVETILTLKPIRDSSKRHSNTWSEFHIYSVTNDNHWTEHCHGLISVQHQRQQDSSGGTRLITQSSTVDEFRTTLPMPEFYEHLSSIGLDYGEVFQNLVEAHSCPDKLTGVLQLPATTSTMPLDQEHTYVIHPATLDAILHTVFGALSADTWLQDPAIPVFVSSLFISADMPFQAGHLLKANATISTRDNQTMKTNILVTNDNNNTPVVQFSELDWRFLPTPIEQEDVVDSHHVAYTLDWAADVEFLEFQDAQQISHSAADYIHLLGFKNPEISVLDISASSSTTLSFLKALEIGNSAAKQRCRAYTVANAQKTKTVLVSDTPNLAYDLVTKKSLDLEIGPQKPDFELESFDVIIVSASLVPSSSPDKALDHIKSLLRPGGRLIVLHEGAMDQDPILLEWKISLQQTGFTNHKLTELDYLGERVDQGSLFVAYPSQELHPAAPEIIVMAEDHNQAIDTGYLASLLGLDPGKVERGTIHDVAPAEKIRIVWDPAGELLSSPSIEQFEAVKRIFTQSDKLLWVTSGRGQGSRRPESSMIAGLARTARTENGAARLVTLDLDDEDKLSQKDTVNIISAVVKRSFLGNEQQDMAESEYVERKGIVTIPRLSVDDTLNQALDSYLNSMAKEIQLLHHKGITFCLRDRPHAQEPFSFQEITVDEELKENEIQVEVKAMTLVSGNSVDIFTQDISGVVVKVGGQVLHLSPGDRVFGAVSNRVSNSYKGRASSFRKIPDGVPFEIAVSYPTAYSTAYHSIHRLANLSKTDKVFVSSAVTPIGRALIDLCSRNGAKVYVGVSNDKEALFMESTLHLPKDQIVYNNEQHSVAALVANTEGHGMDVIFNTLSGEILQTCWNCIAPYGRFIELGTQDLIENSRLEMANFRRNTSFSALDFSRLQQERLALADEIWGQTLELISNDSFSSAVPNLQLFNSEGITQAFERLMDEENTDHVVLTFNPSDRVKVLPTTTEDQLFHADASYLLVGGLGGIGRATASWMVEHGAKNLIFANRSGMSKQEAKDTVHALKSMGARVHVQKCDVSNTDSVRKLVDECANQMPPIRGVIQGAMVLRDMLLEKLTLDDWNAVVRPKVHGTWNLHNHLPKDMDFFVMLSSISGIIGNTTQAAYAAGNTFLDAFSGFRNAQGLPAVTLDLGAISGVGYLASEENKELSKSMQDQGFSMTDEKLLLALIRSAIVQPFGQEGKTQTITGLGTWRSGRSLSALETSMFSHFRRHSQEAEVVAEKEQTSNGKISVKDALRSSESVDDAAGVICNGLLGYLASRSGVSVENFSSEMSLTECGVDSIVAVDVRNWIARELESSIPLLELLANHSLSQLSVDIASRSKLVPVEVKSRGATAT
ncbi:hypothetical protein COCMIDRAFT_5016 [Bipolaris oryzae ATCC 44560]|uniref:Uncharacterized protein n=1 Tax=Bipolaris oryzae ATCC 44560 TaxID=930090 RepID=W6Z7N3_COCMI|nr:uncharacterized protein COCMIDRAFT_5016 [Bipolaris oryzae ATCC 44560]EUC45778.1 hypothetical protein COCMIDRAFT_5016 [Bipolaris oryzae ATCC 44560]